MNVWKGNIQQLKLDNMSWPNESEVHQKENIRSRWVLAAKSRVSRESVMPWKSNVAWQILQKIWTVWQLNIAR